MGLMILTWTWKGENFKLLGWRTSQIKSYRIKMRIGKWTWIRWYPEACRSIQYRQDLSWWWGILVVREMRKTWISELELECIQRLVVSNTDEPSSCGGRVRERHDEEELNVQVQVNLHKQTCHSVTAGNFNIFPKWRLVWSTEGLIRILPYSFKLHIHIKQIITIVPYVDWCAEI